MSRKVKYSVAFKLKAVKRCQSGKALKSKICSELGVHKSSLNHWVKYYDLHGISGLEPKFNHYTVDFKLKVIQQMKKRALSLKSACLKYEIPSPSTLSKWIAIYEKEGIPGFYKKKGRPKKMHRKLPNKKTRTSLTREQALLEENKSLKAELDLLKKLNALIQEKQDNKKKH